MSLPLVLVVVATAAETANSNTRPDAAAKCAEMMQQSNPEGRNAMREFMQSELAPQAMGNRMEMARRMGDGDVMLGMTRMMEMMGSMGRGKMGQGGMMLPRGRTLWLGAHTGLYRNEDGGGTWARASLPAHGAGAGLYRTSDGGQKWVRVDDGPPGETKVLGSVNIPTGMGGIFLYAGTGDGLQRNPDCF